MRYWSALVGVQLIWGGVAWIFDVDLAPTLIIAVGLASLLIAWNAKD